MAFEAQEGSELMKKISEEVNKEKSLMRLSWEKINSKSYAVIHFEKPITQTDKGFYSGSDQKEIKKFHGYYIKGFSDKLIEFYKRENAKSVVDFGCGLCDYAMNIKNSGIEVEAYDGNPYTAQLTKGFAQSMDLTEKQDLKKQFDWVQSF